MSTIHLLSLGSFVLAAGTYVRDGGSKSYVVFVVDRRAQRDCRSDTAVTRRPFPIISSSIAVGMACIVMMVSVFVLSSKPVSVEFRVMIPLLRAFKTIVEDHQQKQAEHPADDFGYPICTCEPCTAKLHRMNARHIDAMLNHGVDLDRVESGSHQAMAEIDYDGDMGREWQDTQRARAQASGRVVDRSIPHVKAPSIVPDTDEGA